MEQLFSLNKVKTNLSAKPTAVAHYVLPLLLCLLSVLQTSSAVAQTTWMGFQFTTGSTPISVNSLGRVFAPGNSQTHRLKLVSVSDGKDVSGSSVSLSMAGGTVGEFKYASLPRTVTLLPNKAYYLVSEETEGGDSWYGADSKVTTTNVAICQGGVYWDGSGWVVAGGQGSALVPVNFTYGYRDPENPAGATNGLDYAYYENSGEEWRRLGNFEPVTPIKTGQKANFELSGNNREDNFAFRFTGYVDIPRDGEYTFYTYGDDAANFYIANALVVRNEEGLNLREKEGKIALKAGKHAITVDYLEKGGGQSMYVKYEGPGVAKQNIPASALYRGGSVSETPGPVAGNTAPSVNLTSPTTGSGFNAPASITIAANVADSDGQVTKVEFYQGGTKLGEKTSAPWSYTWSNVGEGNYSITAKATDNAGAATTSSAVSITVTGTTAGTTPPASGGNTTAGLNYSYYEGNWNGLPDFAALTPVKTGETNNFSLAPRNRNDYFGFQFTGYIQVPTNGTYTFYTSSDDGSKVFIGSTQVVNNDGLHAAVERSGNITLTAGKHPIRVIFFEKAGGEVLDVSWSGPGIGKQLIPNGVLSRDGSSTAPPPVTETQPSAATFYRAVNVNGSALSIDGKNWEGGNAPNYSHTGTPITKNHITLNPGTDANRTAMIRSSVYAKNLRITLSSVPSGNYDVYFYVWEDNYAETFNISVEGVLKGSHNSGAAGSWAKLGPYKTTVNDGSLDLTTVGGDANISGIEVWKSASTANARLAFTAEPTLTLFPNPASDKITVSFRAENEGSGQAVITDATGQARFNRKLNLVPGVNTFDLNVNSLNSGVYFLKVAADGKEANEKLVISK